VPKAPEVFAMATIQAILRANTTASSRRWWPADRRRRGARLQCRLRRDGTQGGARRL